jgi:predicted metalloprotease
MRYDESHESPDIVDRRGEGPVRGGANIGGLLYILPWLLRTPYGWIVIVGAVIWYVARSFLFGGPTVQGTHGGDIPVSGAPAETPEVHFVAFVLDDAQTVWTAELAEQHRAYRHAKLVLYTNATQTGCGFGQAATGPFYCPEDERVYIDLGFFRELSGKLGARGQFAEAYVVAHELGHHVQKLLGISEKVDSMRRTSGAEGASVRLELQADCFAGIWAHSTDQRSILDKGDIESALSAAAAVGDDRLQRQATGTVSPESWTHGSSEERVRWFQRGYQSGSMSQCDTFGAAHL